MTFNFLIDECLSPELVPLAVEAGHAATCVRNRGWLGRKDHELIELAVQEDFTLVTHNAVDFRGRGPQALGGHHNRQPIHAGLVCLNSVHAMDIGRQCSLFSVVLEELIHHADLVNQALEIFESNDGSLTLEIYEIPQG